MRKGKYSLGKEILSGKQRIVHRRRLLPGVREIHQPANPTGVIKR